MRKLLAAVLLFTSLLLPARVFAVVVAQQNQKWDESFRVWQMIQELGDDLNGTADKFTFRVSTLRSNQHQFDFTAINTRIYDKFDNSYIYACLPPGANYSDRLAGLIFNTKGVPDGFEDVSIDFSCRNYPFIPGHRYLIFISNANMSPPGNGILFGAASYNTGSDLFTGGGLRYGMGCNPVRYKWGGTDPYGNYCYVWQTPQDDIYFTLTNNSPPPKTPVVFIPGIGGSEFKAGQDIYWTDQDNGHGGRFSYAYKPNEKIWVNQDEAVKLGDDDYFDVLRLRPDGVTPEAPAVTLTGNLTPFGYGDIDPFFTGLGYEKDKNFFVFPYDWRKDIRTTQSDLDALVETARQKTGLSKVNIVAHSMGGLVARNYISDINKAAKVNKLIELGVPHLGTVYSLKTLLYGTWLARDLYLIKLGIVPEEVKDVFRNLTSEFQLLPSQLYYDFYNKSDDINPLPFSDDRDIDNNSETGDLNFSQLKILLSNLGQNMAVFNLGEQFHNLIDPLLNQSNGVKLYNIVGSGQPTLGQLRETYWITWPIDLIPKTDEIFINGDDTVPLYSASLKSDSLDLSGSAKIYYVEQKHSDLVSQNGFAMQTVKKILSDDDNVPVEVKSEKYTLEGKHISVDGDADLDLYDEAGNHTGINEKGEIETNIPDSFYSTSKKTKNAFVKKKSAKATVKVKSNTKKQSAIINIRSYQADKVIKTTTYHDVPVDTVTPVVFSLDPATDAAPVILAENNTITPFEATGSASLDQKPPKTTVQIAGTKNSAGIYTGPVTVTFTASDSESGVFRIEYSLDNGKTIQIYSQPFIISTPGITVLQFKTIDNSGNSEIPQTLIIEIETSPSPTSSPTPSPSLIPTPSPTPTASETPTPGKAATPTPSPTPTPSQNPKSLFTNPFITAMNIAPSKEETSFPFPSPEVLGTSYQNPQFIYAKADTNPPDSKPDAIQTEENPAVEFLSGLLMAIGGGVLLGLSGFIPGFLKPPPKQMYHPKPN